MDIELGCEVAEPGRPVRYLAAEVLLAPYRRHGPVIHEGVGGYGYVCLLGHEANKFVFANSAAFSWWDAG